MENVAAKHGNDPDFDHPFFEKVANLVREGDQEQLIREKVPLKLLRLTPAAQDGMVLIDFPYEPAEAELLEEYRGGLNAFVHVSLPDEVLVDIEETKIVCADCSKTYYKDDVRSDEHGVRIDKHLPEDGFCYDCGSTNLVAGSDPMRFERDLEIYQSKKDNLLSFYNDLGLLVDFEPRHGYDDYEKLKRSIQYTIKH
jgi:adenylate kinase family enzyme|mmetsp:Transcript_45396/g.60265  ORF Transcript_45396/g.60265 Transcript_45396/m.60265 type:complete len:197 (-) Transcript_45396:158-748(-)|eukprot:CAMPEP_0185580384 /NCGR_PEP_ID=MMETSP0434-20130131/16318_1 /TAXON_ID=626734 ORGANISM="Favella taraikaensis, Strain Fe Narragansett Bay" /NCGR_SAMPLE_ID=MMETSP0434 /ASSEMBLY_ACC=CAM_ASM_000379 /LENGTH=196 /DNA_ID=CAMNT_0028198625 /DNA_START=192 /DNA_END=782 /DNA_ORIENTATION=+